MERLFIFCHQTLLFLELTPDILWLRGTGKEPVSWLRVLGETTNPGGHTSSEFIIM